MYVLNDLKDYQNVLPPGLLQEAFWALLRTPPSPLIRRHLSLACMALLILTTWTFAYVSDDDEGTASVSFPFLPWTIISHFQTNITSVALKANERYKTK